MDAREAAARQEVGGDDASTTRMGAVALPMGVVLIAISEIFHPSREDPMDFPAVFKEYSQSDVWTTVHFGEYFGFLSLLDGLVALYYSISSARPGLGAGLAPFGFAAAVTAAAASFTVLQAVDGVTLRYAVHNWVSAPAPQKPAAFAAAEVARWTEIGMNALSYFLAGLTLFLFGLAIALGRVYPRWVGLIAVISGAALMYDGAVVVAYEGFVADIVKLVGLLLLAMWAFIMAFLMWRNGSRRRSARLGPPSQAAAQRPAGTR
jgi:hypothetical protein